MAKDTSKLVRKIIVDKDGHKRAVWVKPGEDPNKVKPKEGDQSIKDKYDGKKVDWKKIGGGISAIKREFNTNIKDEKHKEYAQKVLAEVNKLEDNLNKFPDSQIKSLGNVRYTASNAEFMAKKLAKMTDDSSHINTAERMVRINNYLDTF